MRVTHLRGICFGASPAAFLHRYDPQLHPVPGWRRVLFDLMAHRDYSCMTPAKRAIASTMQGCGRRSCSHCGLQIPSAPAGHARALQVDGGCLEELLTFALPSSAFDLNLSQRLAVYSAFLKLLIWKTPGGIGRSGGSFCGDQQAKRSAPRFRRRPIG
jgi:hypothetical protein